MGDTRSAGTSDIARFAAEKYLEQVKLLTALATALLISPSVLVAVVRLSTDAAALVPDIGRASWYLLLSSGAFVFVVVANYLIYSSIVGQLVKGTLDLYRPATRLFSICQLAFLTVGCLFLVLFVVQLLQPV